jgi:hypothetical protein
MSKPTIGMLVGLFVSMSMLAFAPALAGPHTDAMAECLEVISKLGISGDRSIAWWHAMASAHRRAVEAD